MSSCSDDGTVHIFHARVYDDMLKVWLSGASPLVRHIKDYHVLFAEPNDCSPEDFKNAHGHERRIGCVVYPIPPYAAMDFHWRR